MRRWWLAAAAGLTAIALVACGGDDSGGGAPTPGTDPAVWQAEALSPDPNTPIVPILVNSNLGTGENRLAFALLDANGAPILGARVSARFYRLDNDPATGEVTAARLVTATDLTQRTIAPGFDHVHPDGVVHAHGSNPVAIYTATLDLTEDRFWGAEIDAQTEAATLKDGRVLFFVQADPPEPRVGEAAPASRQRTLSDEPEISLLDSSIPPNPDLHDITVADALASGKPLVVVFATPQFCQTQFCGPVLEEAILPLRDAYGAAVEIIHIEPFDLTRVRQGTFAPVEATIEWGLATEPWVFVVDADGRIAARFEGIVEAAEIRAVLDRLLARADAG